MLRIWLRATELAKRTPAKRNRYIDFIRALSILVVVTGHWLMVAVYYGDGRVLAYDLLQIAPRMQWLTWIFQVMPMFFIVGGYSNAASLTSARQRGTDYAEWLAGRLHRLVTPLLLLIIGWGVLAFVLHLFGTSGALLQLGSRAALIPTWFLAIYVLVVVLAPALYEAWHRWGFVSLLALAALGALVDLAFFAADLRWLGWTNYLWVWLAVHQLGYAWHDGRTGGRVRWAACAVLGFLALLVLVGQGPYPLAMVGSPDEDVSNSLPPKITLLALGIGQLGLLLTVEKPMRRLLSYPRLWAATVLVNGMIMTIYLWHLTVMVIVVALASLAGGFGLGPVPPGPGWWLSRPIWIAFLYAALFPVVLLLSPFESRARGTDTAAPRASRQVAGAALIGFGVALLARFGFGNAPLPRLDVIAFIAVCVGAGLSGLLPRRR